MGLRIFLTIHLLVSAAACSKSNRSAIDDTETTNSDIDSSSDNDSDADIDGDADVDADADESPDNDNDTGTSHDTGSDSDIGTDDKDNDTDNAGNTDADTDIDADTDTDTDTDADTDADADADTDSDSDSDSDMQTELDTGTTPPSGETDTETNGGSNNETDSVDTDTDHRPPGLQSACRSETTWPMYPVENEASFMSDDGAYGFQTGGAVQSGILELSLYDTVGFLVNQNHCPASGEADPSCAYPSIYRGVGLNGDRTPNAGGLPMKVNAVTGIYTCFRWAFGGSDDDYVSSIVLWFGENESDTSPKRILNIWFHEPRQINRVGPDTFPEADGVIIGNGNWTRWFMMNEADQWILYYTNADDFGNNRALDLDLKDFVDDAVEKGHVKASDYLISIMVGIELWTEGTGASIQEFRTEVKSDW